MQNGPICTNSARVNSANFDDLNVSCSRCGNFFITSFVLEQINLAEKHKLAIVLRERK